MRRDLSKAFGIPVWMTLFLGLVVSSVVEEIPHHQDRPPEPSNLLLERRDEGFVALPVGVRRRRLEARIRVEREDDGRSARCLGTLKRFS